jgi:hypothetical protein
MRFLFAIGSIVLASVALAQEDSMWTRYAAGVLHDGLYKDFRSFRSNSPTVPSERLRDDQGLPVRDIRSVVSKMYWQPDTGGQQVVRKDRLWGFCQGGVVYVSAGNGFYRIGLMGSLAHMVYEVSYRDWDPYMYAGGYVTRTALMHQLLDMNSGEYLPFNSSGMDKALAHDPVLQEEYRSLPKKQRDKDEVLFRFLRLYNDRNPLFFPL